MAKTSTTREAVSSAAFIVFRAQLGRGELAQASSLCRRHKPVTAGDGRHLQVKRGMTWMTALIQQGLARLLAAEDRHQRRRLLVVLSEVTAEPALTVMKRLHSAPPSVVVKVGQNARRESCFVRLSSQ